MAVKWRPVMEEYLDPPYHGCLVTLKNCINNNEQHKSATRVCQSNLTHAKLLSFQMG